MEPRQVLPAAVIRSPARRVLAGIAWLALGGLLLATVLAQFARLGWLAELATHFRIQYLACGTLLALAFAILRQPRPMLLAVALLALNGWYSAPWLLPGEAPPAGAAPQLVSLNLYYRSQAYATVRDYLRSRDPDVLVLSELTPVWGRELESVISRYPFRMSLGQWGPWGLGVFSRYPLRDAALVNLGVPGSVNVRAIVALPGGDVELLGVHLASPTSLAHAVARNRQLDELARLLGPPRPPVAPLPPRLLVGDMNITPFSPYFGQLLARTGLRDARLADGLPGTWPTWLPPMRITIDHCLVDPALAVVAVRRGPPVGSDHYPLEVTLRPAP